MGTPLDKRTSRHSSNVRGPLRTFSFQSDGEKEEGKNKAFVRRDEENNGNATVTAQTLSSAFHENPGVHSSVSSQCDDDREERFSSQKKKEKKNEPTEEGIYSSGGEKNVIIDNELVCSRMCFNPLE